ncbi:unnamed protein product [Strongylus vulgaris]|uniref:Uncharacterized protein n=1 Tax=Strongylus vulgaris TaxID=40348 RepID=A0A3P7K3F2_STRVU|nr:unnamed protein product [Strongylus vulgaris]
MVFRNCAFDRRDYGSEKHLKDLDPTQPVASTALQARVTKEWQSNATLKHFFFNMVLNNSVVVNKTPHHDELEVGFFEHGIYNIGNSSFYDITQDQFKEMVAKILYAHLSCFREGITHSYIVNCNSCADKSVIFHKVCPKKYYIAHYRFIRIVFPIRIPYASIRKRHETLKQKEEFCPYEAESPDELAIIMGK